MKKKAFVAFTGASGTLYGAAVIKGFMAAGAEVWACATDDAMENARAETGGIFPDLSAYLEYRGIKNARIFSEHDHGAVPASGSNRIDYCVAAPASMGFVGRIASGISSNLPERVADVALKEKRTLVVLFRETPLSRIHLENLLRLSSAGAVIMPAAPAFYHRPETVEDMADFMAGKVMEACGLEHDLYGRWNG